MQIRGKVLSDATRERKTTKDGRAFILTRCRILESTIADVCDLQVFGNETQPANALTDAHEGDTVTAEVQKVDIYRERLQLTARPESVAVQLEHGAAA